MHLLSKSAKHLAVVKKIQVKVTNRKMSVKKKCDANPQWLYWFNNNVNETIYLAY